MALGAMAGFLVLRLPLRLVDLLLDVRPVHRLATDLVPDGLSDRLPESRDEGDRPEAELVDEGADGGEVGLDVHERDESRQDRDEERRDEQLHRPLSPALLPKSFGAATGSGCRQPPGTGMPSLVIQPIETAFRANRPAATRAALYGSRTITMYTANSPELSVLPGRDQFHQYSRLSTR